MLSWDGNGGQHGTNNDDDRTSVTYLTALDAVAECSRLSGRQQSAGTIKVDVE